MELILSIPQMPKHTCPIIDKLKRRIEDAYVMADDPPKNACEESLYNHLAGIAHELLGEAEVLEDIRRANSDLRECAIFWQERAEEFENKLLYAQEQCTP